MTRKKHFDNKNKLSLGQGKFMFDKMVAKLLLDIAKKEQPIGYITVLYSPEYKTVIERMHFSKRAPSWICSVLDGEYSLRSKWDKSGNILKAIALQADDTETRQRAFKLLSFYRVLGPSLWRWKMVFLQIPH